MTNSGGGGGIAGPPNIGGIIPCSGGIKGAGGMKCPEGKMASKPGIPGGGTPNPISNPGGGIGGDKSGGSINAISSVLVIRFPSRSVFNQNVNNL